MKPKIVQVINKISDAMEKSSEMLVAAAFGTMVISVLLSVFTRNVTIPITWLEELARYLQVWFIGVGISLALKKGQLAGTELVLKKLEGKGKKTLIYIDKIIMLVIDLTVLIGAFPVLRLLATTGQKSPTLRIPVLYIYLGIYLGFILSAIYLVFSIIKNIYDDPDTLDITFETTEKEMNEMEMSLDIMHVDEDSIKEEVK